MNNYPLRSKIKKMGPKGNPTYSKHIKNLVENDIIALMKQPITKMKSNLIHKEHVAMKELVRRKYLIIPNAVKVALLSLWTQATTSEKPISNYLAKQVTNN